MNENGMMSKNKIVLFINSLQGGGAERVCVNLANGLYKKGFDVELLVLHLNNAVYQNELDKSVQLINLDILNARKSLFAVKKFLDERKPEKILVFNHQLAVLLVLLRKLFRLKFIIIARNINTLSKKYGQENSIWHKYFVQNIVKYLYRDVDKVITQSHGMAADLIELFKVDKNKITTINNPVNKTLEEEVTKIDFSKVEKKHEILFAGSLTEQKGLFYLLDAFNIVLKSDSNLKLRILGKGHLKEKLEARVIELGIENSVIFESFSTNVIPYYLQAKAVVLTSLYEGFPNVLVESIALGTPVISFDCQSGPDEIIEEGINGYLVPFKNVEVFADCIQKILSQELNRNDIINSAKRFYNDNILNQYISALRE